jgi:hypothetical protein
MKSPGEATSEEQLAVFFADAFSMRDHDCNGLQ